VDQRFPYKHRGWQIEPTNNHEGHATKFPVALQRGLRITCTIARRWIQRHRPRKDTRLHLHGALWKRARWVKVLKLEHQSTRLQEGLDAGDCIQHHHKTRRGTCTKRENVRRNNVPRPQQKTTRRRSITNQSCRLITSRSGRMSVWL